jgi:hypothetical protein
MGLLRRLLDLFAAFFAIWIIVWFVKFLFTHRWGWVGWLAIVGCAINLNYFPQGTWFGIEEVTMYSRDVNWFEELIGLNFK